MAGGAGWAGAPAALLRSVRRLREVFEVCGRDPDGFLRVERVAALGLRFGQGEEVEKLVKCLDPNDLGRINFKDFCRGVFAMKGCEELLKDVLSVESAGTLPCSPDIPDCVEQGSDFSGSTDGEQLPREPDFFQEDEEEAMTLALPEGPQELDMDSPMESSRSSSGLGEFNARAREVELEHEVKRLKQENHKLRDQNDDLNGQILSLSLYEAKNLFATQTKAQSLAAEIDTASRDELMEASHQDVQ